MPQSPASRFAFVKLSVPDIAEARRFWADAFGMEQAMAFDEPGFAEVVMSAGPGDDAASLILVRHKNGRTIESGSAYGPVGFFCDDIEASFARALEAGGTATKPPFTVGGGTKVALLDSPQGHAIELVQLPQG